MDRLIEKVEIEDQELADVEEEYKEDLLMTITRKASASKDNSSLRLTFSANPTNDDDEADECGLGVLVDRMCRRHDAQHSPLAVVETVFENQRWSGVNYLPNLAIHPLGAYNSDNPIFSKVFKAQYPIDSHAGDPTGLPNPDLWMWCDDWKMQPIQTILTNGKEVESRASDKEGWFYAFDWPSEFRPEAKNFYSYVRRRKWERKRRELTAVEFFKRAIELGHSREFLHDICTLPACIKATGEIDFKFVLFTLASSARNDKSPADLNIFTSIKNTGSGAIVSGVSVSDAVDSEDSNSCKMECLAKSCQIANVAYDIILNARMTMFFKHFSNTAPPLPVSLGDLGGIKEDALWCLANGKRLSLTPRGCDMFRGLFRDISCTELIFNDAGDDKSTNNFIPQIVKLIMQDHHDVCGWALTVLRRELNQVSDLMALVKKTLVVTNDHHCKQIETINVALNCLAADTNSYMAANLSIKLSSFSLLNNIRKIVKLLLQTITPSENSFGNQAKDVEALQDAICMRGGHLPLLRVFMKSLITMKKQDQCSPACQMFQVMADFLCELCADNDKSKLCMMPFTINMFQVFRYTNAERGCSCLHECCVRVVANVFHAVDYDSAHFSVSFIPLVVSYLDPDLVRASVLMRVTGLVKDILHPNRKRIVAAFQPVVLKAVLRATRNKTMFFENSTFQSRSQMSKRLTFLQEYGEAHDLNFIPISVEDAEPRSIVTLLFHTECVEILALCCEEVSNHINPMLSSLLTAETLLKIMTDSEIGSAQCPPLMYSYGLFFYCVYLKNSDSTKDSAMRNFFHNNMMWQLLKLYSTIAVNPSSLQNAYRPFIFDVAIPTVECALKGVPMIQKTTSFDAADAAKYTREIRGSMQALLETLLSLPSATSDITLTSAERAVVEDACLYFNVSVSTSEDITPKDQAYPSTGRLSLDQNSDSPSTVPPADDFLGIYDKDEPVFEYEMSSTSQPLRMSSKEIMRYTSSLMDSCDVIEQIRKETSTEHLITTLLLQNASEDHEQSDTASTVTSEENRSLSSFATTQDSFFGTLVKRLIIFCLKSISSVRSDECQQQTLDNLILIFDIFTVTLRRARLKDSQSSELEDLQLLMNNNSAGQLIVEVISMNKNGQVGAEKSKNEAILDHALEFAGEFLFNGNRQCQKSLLGLVRGDANSLRPRSFFSSIMQSIKYYTEVIRSMIHSRNGIKAMDMSGDLTASVSSNDIYVKTLARAQSTFVLLQLHCEGHYLEMQECFENTECGYHIVTMTALLCEQILPVNLDISHLLRCEMLVAYAAIDFLIEVVQGPCLKNQRIIEGHERFISTMARFSASKVPLTPETFSLLGKAFSSKIRKNDMTMWEPVDFYTLKVMKNKCLILRLGLLEGRKCSSQSNHLRATHLKYVQGDDPRERLQCINQEYRVAKRLCRQAGFSAKRSRTINRLIRSEAHLTLSYYTALKRWLPTVQEHIIPLSMPIVRRKQMGSYAEYQAAQRAYKKLDKYKRIYSSYMDRQRIIEVFWMDKGLFQISFQKPRQCEFITEEIKSRVADTIDFNNDDKVALFLKNVRTVSTEMKLQMDLKDSNLHFILFFQDEIGTFLICISFIINFIMSISLQKGYLTGDSDPQYSHDIFSQLVMVLQWMQVWGYFTGLMQTLVLVAPVARVQWHETVEVIAATSNEQLSMAERVYSVVRHYIPFVLAVIAVVIVNVLMVARYERMIPVITLLSALLLAKVGFHSYMAAAREPFIAKSAMVGWIVIGLSVVTATKTLTVLFFTVMAVLCTQPHTPYFNSIMLLAIVFKSSTLQNVIKSVTIPFNALALSSLLGLICLYQFALFGFYFFPHEFYNEDQSIDECSTVMLCFVAFLHGGFLSGGGIADHLNELGHEPVLSDTDDFSLRVTYDIAFFVLIIILLLNIIFGIIIDTFGSLREEQHEQNHLRTSFCFICGIAKEEFDARALESTGSDVRLLDFADHVKMEHNMWDYMYFLIYLSLKDPNNYDGVESYISVLTSEDDIGWIPKGKTLGINDGDDSDAADSEKRIRKEFSEMSTSLNESLRHNFDATTQAQQTEYSEMKDMFQSMKADIDVLKSKVEELSANSENSQSK